MNTFEIAEVMHLTPDFYEVVPCCLIEQFKKHEVAALIVNTDPHDKPGQHWVALYKKAATVHFFDSFARDIDDFEEPFASIVKDFASGCHIVTNKKRYQNDWSDTCGRWCIYYIISKTCNVGDFSEFSDDTMQNERELQRQFKKISEILSSA